jgi:glycosyltransferase involved in cell wall biosynthesis
MVLFCVGENFVRINMKPTVLTFVDFYLPGFRGGGPIRTIANMVEQIGDDFDFLIVTADRDLDESHPYNSIKVDDWSQVGKAQVFYTSPGFILLFCLLRLMRCTLYDVLYLNSFFSFRFSILPLLILRIYHPKKPIILGPRGEFSGGALRLKSFKKRIFIACSQMLGLYKNVIWHASTDYEAEDIRRVMGHGAHIRKAIDLAMTGNDIQPVSRSNVGPLRVVFISRISPKKNLLGALSLLRNVFQEVRFDVFGPAEDEAYWIECRDAAAALPDNVVFTYRGALEPLEVAPTLAKYDLFLFPTFGENYGHVIAEALSAGLPILISDTTPWRNLEETKLGWDVPLDQPDRFVACIEECCAKSADEYDKWRREIRRWAVANIGNQDAVHENRRLFNNLD